MSLVDAVPPGATVTVDAAPIIYVLDGHPSLAEVFLPVFAAAESGRNPLVISAITVAEVLSGPLRRRREALATRYRQVLTTSPGWSVLPVDAEVAETAARFRIRYGLRLPDAIQLATAIESGSIALVTHDRDFSRVKDVRILTGT